MPAEPPGEAGLRALSERFARAEARIRALVAGAPEGDPRKLLTEALTILLALRRLDARDPIATAYLAAFGSVVGGPARRRRARTDDLAGSLALRLDRGAQTAYASAREAFARASPDNLEQVRATATTAHVDSRGTRWPLGAWAYMNTTTIGRQASTRGVVDAVGAGAKLIVEVSGCSYCETFAGEAIVGEDPLPPFHPSCTCTASAA
jgi:hypothetical protein